MGGTYSVSAVTIKIPILLFFVLFRKSIVLSEFLLIKLYLSTIDLFWITLPAESLRSFLDKMEGDSVRRVILLKNKLEKIWIFLPKPWVNSFGEYPCFGHYKTDIFIVMKNLFSF